MDDAWSNEISHTTTSATSWGTQNSLISWLVVLNSRIALIRGCLFLRSFFSDTCQEESSDWSAKKDLFHKYFPIKSSSFSALFILTIFLDKRLTKSFKGINIPNKKVGIQHQSNMAAGQWALGTLLTRTRSLIKSICRSSCMIQCTGDLTFFSEARNETSKVVSQPKQQN